jgi:peptidoglycan hydrolase-like protein with peptidoglycan-binding domain
MRSAPSGGAPFFVTRNHKLGNTSPDIKLLQQFLNTHGYTIVTSGPGSPSDETDRFGALTYQALKKFQKAHNLPAIGFLGPLTRQAVASSTYQ